MSRLSVKTRTLDFVVALRNINHSYAALSDTPENALAVKLFDDALARSMGAGPSTVAKLPNHGMRGKVHTRLVDLVTFGMVVLREFRPLGNLPQNRRAVRRIERELSHEVSRLGK